MGVLFLVPQPILTRRSGGRACPHRVALTRRRLSIAIHNYCLLPPPLQRWNVRIGIPETVFFIVGDSMLQEVVR